MCVEAIWQGLKVFETADVDVNMFANDTMKNISRETVILCRILNENMYLCKMNTREFI